MAYCGKCGAQVADHAAFCPQCGQAQAGAKPAAPPAGSAQSGLSENAAGALCYVLGWLTGIIFFFVDKRPYVRFHAAQSIVVFGALNILSILWSGMFGLGFVMGGFNFWGGWGFAYLIHKLIGLATFVLWILLMVKAGQGERFRLPLAADLADSLAGKPI
jgi:uncharacterized membrane protein